MKHINVLLEKLMIPTDLVEAVSSDNLPEDFDQKLESFNKSRFEYFKATPDFKAIEKQIGDKTYEGAVLKHKKRLNEALGLGLTNAELEAIPSIEEFIEKTKTYLTEKEKKLLGSSDETLKSELEKYKQAASKYSSENQELITKIESVKKEAEERANNTIEQFKAETYFHKMVSEDKKLPNTEGQDFILDSIKNRIFSEYIVKGDGTILSKDGTHATHPEKPTIINKIDDIYEYLKHKANLVIRSNAGVGASGIPGGGSNPTQQNLTPQDLERISELRKARTA